MTLLLETERLVIRHLSPGDADFILGLLNQPSFLRFVGDKGVRTREEAERYIQDGPVASYDRHGFGLYLLMLKPSHEPIGICGLVRRPWLDDPDLGFSLLPQYWSRGLAAEAALAVINHERARHQLPRILAITDPANQSSIRLLERLGFSWSQSILNPEGENLDLYLRRLDLEDPERDRRTP